MVSGTETSVPTLADAEAWRSRQIAELAEQLQEHGHDEPWARRLRQRLDVLQRTRAEEYLRRRLERDAGIRAEEQREEQGRRQERWESLIAKRGVRYRDCTLENFHCTSDAQREVVETIRDYLAHLGQHLEDGTNIVLYGGVGTGKDQLLVPLMREAVLRYGAFLAWDTGVGLAAHAKESLACGYGEDSGFAPIPRFQGPDVHIISDPCPPGGSPAFYAASRLNQVIDSRYSNRKATWVTINAESKQHATELLGSQIVDRLTDGAVVLYFDWPSYRRPLAWPRQTSANK
jgi:DNA replication protein DnaC